MKKFSILILSIMLGVNSMAQEKLQSPSEFLGYDLGERFTRHHKVVEYFEHVAKFTSNMSIKQYGETYENRPLIIATISSADNMANIDEIRKNNLKRTQLIEGEPTKDDIAIVWLSYNIHGNEASSIEASMKTIYELANPSNEKTKAWLKNTVVIVDPCINPDGRDRYANFYNQYGNKNYNPNGNAIEHHEPWPGGRVNHYLFDLNRDWAWQTQIESSQRSIVYHEWMPHIHVDFHEQFINNPYYFAPAAEPFHEIITPWQREFQTKIGKNHAKYFDKEGWLYFTKESFDLLYPSYGDTYPTYNGAIGMTYEQAGHGYAGLGIITEYGDTLTLKDRIEHHYTTSISTVEIASQNAAELASNFDTYFDDNVNNPQGKYKTYIIKNSSGAEKLKALTQFLDNQKIKYGTNSSGKTYRGFSYQNNISESVKINKEDLVISLYQPTARLVTSLFEPLTKLADTLTYDITAWSLPYAYGLDAYALAEKVTIDEGYEFNKKELASHSKRPYAYVASYNSIESVKWLSAIIQKEINVRVAHKTFTIDGQKYDKGTLIVTRRNNEQIGLELDEIIAELSDQMSVTVMPVYTGFSDSGVDLGSSYIARLEAPKVALIGGDQTSPMSFGEIWHFFEQQIDYPVTVVGTDYISRVDLSDYNVLIVPNGRYRIFNESFLADILTWVSQGGKLIIIGNGLNSFKDQDGFSLKEFLTDKLKEEAEEQPTMDDMLLAYSEQERKRLTKSIFGAIYQVRMDNTHPLAYGYGSQYFSLKTNNLRFSFLEGGGNVGVLKGLAQPVSGFSGYKTTEKLENSLVFGVEPIGGGNVIYMVDNPLFRGFWENGKLLFSNAVFVVD